MNRDKYVGNIKLFPTLVGKTHLTRFILPISLFVSLLIAAFPYLPKKKLRTRLKFKPHTDSIQPKHNNFTNFLSLYLSRISTATNYTSQHFDDKYRRATRSSNISRADTHTHRTSSCKTKINKTSPIDHDQRIRHLIAMLLKSCDDSKQASFCCRHALLL